MPLRHWRPGVGATAFDGPDNYIGEDLSAWLVGPCFQHRDSDTLSRHNFAWTWEAIRAASTAAGESTEPYINRTGSWAVGWTECVLIHPSDLGAIAEAERWEAKLANYPIADEDAFSAMEWEEACAYWERMSIAERVAMIQGAGDCSVFAARQPTPPDSPYIWDHLRG